MSYTLSSDRPPSTVPQQPRRWLERLLIAAFLFCLVIGLAALALFWVVRNESQPSINVDPLQSVRSQWIVPQIALRELSGDASAALAAQALQAGHRETARAILTFATSIPSVERTARLATLAQSYLAAGEPEIAAQVAHLVVADAILDDALPVRERVNHLIQSAALLYASHFGAAATDAATQALRITAQAPGLLPAQRSALFNDLRDAMTPYANQSEATRALNAQVADFARNPYLIGAGVLVTPTMAAFAQPIAYDSSTQEKIAARQQAARILADRIEFTGGADIEPERQALAAALLAEDAARTQFYQNPGEIARGQQLWLLLDRRAWLVEKLRVAMLGYGLVLVPEWEAQTNQILSDLNAAHSYLATVMAAYASDQSALFERTLLQLETQHWLAQQAMHGFYPNAPVATIGELLRTHQDELTQQGNPLALPIAYDATATPPGFRIQPLP
ncbi:MAG TPA: hypothetical protein DCL15_01145 [Chloroflexi bacterium]|nr:hypothetical protein [Chloroflexota bacterium]HHW85433.1 hypothetical protein [Chloroflexota bacterium]